MAITVTKPSDVTDVCDSVTVITLTLTLGFINRKIKNKSKIKMRIKEKIKGNQVYYFQF